MDLKNPCVRKRRGESLFRQRRKNGVFRLNHFFKADLVVAVHIQTHIVAQRNVSGDDFLAQRIFHASLNGAAQRAGS